MNAKTNSGKPLFDNQIAAKWSASDFYDECRDRLVEAIQSGDPFDTGVYASRKEAHWGRVRRPEAGGPIQVQATVAVDETLDLVDTVIWRLSRTTLLKGGQPEPYNGEDALNCLGLKGPAAAAFIAEIADEFGDDPLQTADALHRVKPDDFLESFQSAGGWPGLLEQPDKLRGFIESIPETYDADACSNKATAEQTLPASATFDDVVNALDDCIDEANKEAEQLISRLEAICKERLKTLGVQIAEGDQE